MADDSQIWEFSDELNIEVPTYIYKTSVDRRGHSRVIQTRVPPDWEANIHKVLKRLHFQDGINKFHSTLIQQMF